jgi:hypothetical protein
MTVCDTQLTQQISNHHGRSRTTTSRSQQQIRTKSGFTATAGAGTCDLWHAGAVPLTAPSIPNRKGQIHDGQTSLLRFLVYRVQRTMCSHSWTTETSSLLAD